MQHAIERARRPGGSHEGVGRKKIAVAMLCVTLMCAAGFEQHDSRQYLNGASNRPPGGTGFRMLRAQFWTLAQANAFKGDAKVDPLRIEVVHPGGSVFGSFVSDF